MLDQAVYQNRQQLNFKSIKSINSAWANSQKNLDMDPNMLFLLDFQETVFLKFIINFTLFNPVKNMIQLIKSKLRLNFQGIPIYHIQSKGMQQFLFHVQTIRVFWQLSDHMDVVFIPLILRKVGNLFKKFQLCF